MSKILHAGDNDNDEDNAMAIVIPWVLSENNELEINISGQNSIPIPSCLIILVERLEW